MGEEEHYPDDPEAQAVADFARAEAAAEEERRELAADPGGSLESGPPPPDPEPVTESVPVEPTEEDKERHRLTHLPFQAWCPECVQGAGRGVRQTPGRKDWRRWSKWTTRFIPEVPSRGWPQRMNPFLVTVLTLVDRDTGWPCSVQVPKKGAECGNFVLDTVEQYLNTLGHSRVTLQIDSEGSLRSVATAIRTRMGPQKVKVRESPPYSHQSQGAVEGEHSFLAGLVRTWLMDLQNRYPNCGVDVNHTVFPWLVKYAAWSTARFQVRTTDKMTPYNPTRS